MRHALISLLLPLLVPGEAFQTSPATLRRHRHPASIAPCRRSKVTALLDRQNKNADDEYSNIFQTPWVFESVAGLKAFGGVKKSNESPQSEHDRLLQEKNTACQNHFFLRAFALIGAHTATCLHLVSKLLKKQATNNNFLATAVGISSYKSFLQLVLMNQILAAGMTYLATDAASNSRLESNTYKRLNGVLALYGVTGVLMGATTILSQSNSASLAVYVKWSWWMALSLAAAFHSLKGYAVGVNKGWIFEEQRGGKRRYLGDLATQTKSMAKHLLLVPFPRNLQALVYWAASTTMASVKAVTIVRIVQHIRSTPLGISGSQSMVRKLAQLGLLGQLTGMYVVLKDAADRGRLEGNTFIRLNCLSSVASAFLSAALRQGLCGPMPLAALAAKATEVFSISTAFFAISGLVAKKYKHKYHDETLQNNKSRKLSDDFPLEE